MTLLTTPTARPVRAVGMEALVVHTLVATVAAASTGSGRAVTGRVTSASSGAVVEGPRPQPAISRVRAAARCVGRMSRLRGWRPMDCSVSHCGVLGCQATPGTAAGPAAVAQAPAGQHLASVAASLTEPMSPYADRSQRIDAMFDALLDLPQDEQLPFLDRAAGADPELHDEVLRLLKAHRRAEGFLDTPAPRVARELIEQPTIDTGQVPDRIGPWRIVRLIGEGGMGAVYLAERADGQFEQRAAIKILHRRTPGMVRRFLEERRILALLEHPGIARLIEGGLTPGGLPYFAMELIDGA